MKQNNNKKNVAGFFRFAILMVTALCLLNGGPVWAVDPEIEDLEQQLWELEARKKREESERKAEEEAKKKAAVEVRRKRAQEAERRRKAEAAQEEDRQRAEAAARAVRDLAGEFVRIESGCFEMGSPDWEEGRDNDEKRHRVCITRAFEIGKYEVTQAQWLRVMGENPSYFSNSVLDCPVESVSWNDVQDFIKKLNSRTGLRYRFPTEAEWEYACRSGGKSEKYCGGNDLDQIGLDNDTSLRPGPVGRKPANGLGLYDMCGNVYEWLQDWYDSDYFEQSPRNDPQGASSGSERVVRGGSWGNGADGLRSADRDKYNPDRRLSILGFRLARSP